MSLRGGAGADCERVGFVQGTAFRSRDYCVLRALVSPLETELSRLGRLVKMITERGMEVTHATILRWVKHFVTEFEKRWSQYSRSVGRSWRCDVAYIKVKSR